MIEIITTAATNMASIVSDKEWLTKNIEDGNIRLYSFTDFIDPMCIGAGGYGVVFKAKAKTLGRTVAYKLLLSPNEDEMFGDFIREVGVYDNLNLNLLFTYTTQLYFSLRSIARLMIMLT